MSKQNIRNIIEKPIQNQASKIANEKFGNLIRRRLQSSALGEQCLVIDYNAIQTIVEAIEASTGTRFSVSRREELKIHLYKELKSWRKPVPRTLKTRYFTGFLQSFKPALRWNVNVIYTGRSFETIRKNIKKVAVKWITDNHLIEAFDSDRWSKSIEIDHGKRDSSVVMMAMGAGGMAAAKRRLRNSDDFKNFEKTLESNIVNSIAVRIDSNKLAAGRIKRRLLNIVTNWEQVVTYQGQIKAGVGMIITPLSGEANKEQSNLEAEEIKILEEALVASFKQANLKISEIKGSSSLNEKMSKVVFENLFGKLSKDWAIKTDLKGIKLNTSTKLSNTLPIDPKYKHKQVPISRAATGKRTTKKQRNLLALQNLLNLKLSSAVERNMVAPALQYRTGRFADSVEVTGIGQTANGYTRIEYDYMRYPYSIFEASGRSPWNIPPDRHPRNIIDKSIRDVAREVITGRFYTALRGS